MKKDLAYLIGALRDGSVFYDKNSRNYQIIWYENNLSWLTNSIFKRVEKYFGKKPRIQQYKKGYYRILVSSQKIYNKIVNDFEFVSPQIFWNTPILIRNASKGIVAKYIAGFFDAEGDLNPKKYMIGFSQKNSNALQFIKEWLSKNDIETSKIFIADKKSGTKRFYITSKENLKRFNQLIEFEHPDKIRRMKILLQLT